MPKKIKTKKAVHPRGWGAYDTNEMPMADMDAKWMAQDYMRETSSKEAFDAGVGLATFNAQPNMSKQEKKEEKKYLRKSKRGTWEKYKAKDEKKRNIKKAKSNYKEAIKGYIKETGKNIGADNTPKDYVKRTFSKKIKTLDPAVKKATNRMDQMDSPFMMYGKKSSKLEGGSPLAKYGCSKKYKK